MDLEARFDAVRVKTQQILDQANKLYGVQIMPTVSFNLKGRVAGWAGCKRCRVTGTARDFTLRFNRELISSKHFDDILNETVAHEIAHLVCFSRPDLGRNHDAGWRRVCLALGGNGKTRHDYDVVVRGRWNYITNLGHQVSVTPRHHRMVQDGVTLRFKRNKGQIDKHSPCAPSGQPIPNVANKVAEPPIPKPLARQVNKEAVQRSQPDAQAAKLSRPTTWAFQVQLMIQAAKREGRIPADVIRQAVTAGMKKSSATNCVRHNWDRV
jgi:predicted SprT family Zn-dependent metalloprotease